MTGSLDKVIFVGIKEPDRETEKGKITLRRLADIAEVSAKDIAFVPSNTATVDIVKSNFIKDPSSKKTGGYKIGNAVCIAADSLDNEYQLKLNALQKLSITVRLGYDDVILENMTEGQIAYWFKNGKYREDNDNNVENTHNTENIGDVNDILDSLLGETQDHESLENKSDKSQRSSENNNDETYEKYFIKEDDKQSDVKDHIAEDDDTGNSSKSDGINPADYHQDLFDNYENADAKDEVEAEAEDDINAMLSMFNNIDDNDSEFGDIDDIIEDNKLYMQDDGSNVEDIVDSSVEDANNIADNNDSYIHNDNYNVNNNTDDTQNNSSTNNSPGSTKIDSDNDVDDMFSSMYDEFGYSDSFQEENESLQNGSTVIENSTPSVVETFNDNDKDKDNATFKSKQDMSAMEKIDHDRELKRRKEELRASLNNSRGISDSIDNTKKENVIDSVQELNNSASRRIESTHNEDGTRKTFREYLDENQNKEQYLIEKSHKTFGTDLSHAHKSKVSGGKIFLVSAGKGGVGKSLVASGIASALALSKAKDVENKMGTRSSNTWLIESDYTAPQMSVSYKTGTKHIGHLADYLGSNRSNKTKDDSAIIRGIIEDNIHIDEETGLRVVACPSIVDNNVDLSMIPLALLLVIKHANNNGDDVIIDHGNLTRAEYSDFDKVLSTELANYVVIVTTASSSTTAWSVAKMLTTRSDGSVSKILNHHQVSIALNKVTNEQYEFLRRELAPYDIGMIIPPINALREENTRDGDVSLSNMPINVKKAIIDRCGLMLVNKLGYSEYSRYFSTKNVPSSKPKTGKKKSSFMQRVVNRFVN